MHWCSVRFRRGRLTRHHLTSPSASWVELLLMGLDDGPQRPFDCGLRLTGEMAVEVSLDPGHVERSGSLQRVSAPGGERGKPGAPVSGVGATLHVPRMLQL